jgi:hypothetical protein
MLTRDFATYVAQQLVAAGGFVLAVGRGVAAWDDRLPPPDATARALEDERARVMVPAGDVAYLADDGTVSASPTPRIRLAATISGDAGQGQGELGPLREVGWFAGGTAAPGSGTLLVVRRHPRSHVGVRTEVRRTLILDLRGAGTSGVGTSGVAETRYVANTRSKELHDLQHLTAACQLDEIRVDHRHGFGSVADALAMDYDRCAFCFGREQSTR